MSSSKLSQCLITVLLLLFVFQVEARDSNFERSLDTVFRDSGMVGLAIAVVRDGEISSIQTFGHLEFGGSDVVDEASRFRIASLSKAFAGTLAAQLEQENSLSLNDKIALSNPSFRLKSASQANSVTLAHALSHRVSLPPYAYDNLLEANTLPTEILAEMKKVAPICGVGVCYAYQNVAFNMVASAIEHADEVSYAESVSKRIFEPLKMKNSSIGKAGLLLDENWARSYRRRGVISAWKKVPVKPAYYRVPAAGGMNDSISDMSKWLLAQVGEATDVLSADVLALTHAPQVRTRGELRRTKSLPNVVDAHYGLGWRIYSYKGTPVVNHSGAVEGYAAQIAFIPEKKSGVVLLTNSRARSFWETLPKFLDEELGLQ